jgi:hypothetical protein
VRTNLRNWSLVSGVLIILVACIWAYVLTKPAEADVSLLQDLFTKPAIASA